MRKHFRKDTIRFWKDLGWILLIHIYLFIIPPQTLTAQSVCSQALRKAQSAYENGRLKEVYPNLKSCLLNGFNKNEQVAAYRLLTLTFIYLEESKKAEEAIINLIKIAPEYKINSTEDPSEFIQLFQSFRTIPIFSVGLKLGGNNNIVHVLQNYTTDNPDMANPSFASRLGFQTGITLDIPVDKKLSVVSEFYLSGRNYRYTALLNDFNQLTFTEKQTWIDLPVLAKYRFGEKIIKYYVTGGAAVSFLQKATSLIKTQTIENSSEDISTTSLNLANLRKNIATYAIVGAGVTYNIGKDYVLAEIKYQHALSDINNNADLDVISELPFQYGYVDNNFRMSFFSFSIGYVHPIYKPKKLR